jgi:predicted phage-related endonuclease
MSNPEQGSYEWLLARCGKITASNFHDVITRSTKKVGDKFPYLKARETYKEILVAEILTGQPAAEINAYAMRHGKEYEPLARATYEMRTGHDVQEVGLVLHPSFEFIGASPDGLIGDDGGLEIKCPKNSTIHLNTWANGLPPEHIGQIQGGLFVTGRQWWDFVSFDPRIISENGRIYIQQIERDDEYIDNLKFELNIFWDEVLDAVAKAELRFGK